MCARLLRPRSRAPSPRDSSPPSATIAGGTDTRHVWDGEKWSGRFDARDSHAYRAVWAAPGRWLYYDGLDTQALRLPTSATMTGVWGDPLADTLWIVGADETIIHGRPMF